MHNSLIDLARAAVVIHPAIQYKSKKPAAQTSRHNTLNQKIQNSKKGQLCPCLFQSPMIRIDLTENSFQHIHGARIKTPPRTQTILSRTCSSVATNTRTQDKKLPMKNIRGKRQMRAENANVGDSDKLAFKRKRTSANAKSIKPENRQAKQTKLHQSQTRININHKKKVQKSAHKLDSENTFEEIAKAFETAIFVFTPFQSLHSHFFFTKTIQSSHEKESINEKCKMKHQPTKKLFSENCRMRKMRNKLVWKESGTVKKQTKNNNEKKITKLE